MSGQVNDLFHNDFERFGGGVGRDCELELSDKVLYGDFVGHFVNVGGNVFAFYVGCLAERCRVFSSPSHAFLDSGTVEGVGADRVNNGTL